jgi:YidC/Oxa1 family membrane protein insertase
MDRVQFGAIAAAILLLVLWFWTLPKPDGRPVPGEPRPVEQQPVRAIETPSPLPPPDDAARHFEATQAVLENDAVRLEVSSLGGRIESVQLKQYRARIGSDSGPVELVTLPSRGLGVVLLGEGSFQGLESIPHTWVKRGRLSASLALERGGTRVERSITIDDRGYGGWVRILIQNRRSEPVSPRIQLVWYGAERPRDAPDYFQNYEVLALVDGDLERRRVSGLGKAGFLGSIFGSGVWQGETYPPSVEWAGIASQYFLVAALIENPTEGKALLAPVGPDQGLSMLSYPSFEVPPGRQLERRYRVYFGPKLGEEVATVDSRLDPALRVGWAWISPIVRLFESMLVGTYRNLVPNYGIAIILLTILLRLITYPLTQKSMKSMRRFQEIAPAMKEVQGKHKDDRARMQQEMMALYQRKGINPVAAMGGGCLPMVIQFPFLIALYFALQGSIELRHAPVLGWIQDLSAPETLFSVGGIPVRLLPLLMGATMVLQQRLAPAGGVDPQQRQMMMWMSVMFIFLFYQFPSGLVLYWFVSNLLGVAQQYLVNRQTPVAKGA